VSNDVQEYIEHLINRVVFKQNSQLWDDGMIL